MYNVDKKIEYLNEMQKGIIPEEFRNDGDGKKYKTLYEKYKAIYDLLSACEKEERDCIEIELVSEKEAWKDLKNYIGIVPIFLSAVAFGISALGIFLDKLLEGVEKTAVLNEMEMMTWVVSVVCVFAIIGYYFFECYPGKMYRRNGYILEVLKKVNDEKDLDKKGQKLTEASEDARMYSVTIHER